MSWAARNFPEASASFRRIGGAIAELFRLRRETRSVNRRNVIVGVLAVARKDLTAAELCAATNLLAGSLYPELIWLQETRIISSNRGADGRWRWSLGPPASAPDEGAQ